MIKILEEILLNKNQEKLLSTNINKYIGKYDIKTYI